MHGERVTFAAVVTPMIASGSETLTGTMQSIFDGNPVGARLGQVIAMPAAAPPSAPARVPVGARGCGDRQRGCNSLGPGGRDRDRPDPRGPR